MNIAEISGVRFDIAPVGGLWVWRTFDLRGLCISQGQAGSRREAAALVIRETIRNCVPEARDLQAAA